VPIDGPRSTVVAMVTALRTTGAIATPRISTGSAESEAEQAGNSDSSG
jgi:hypothetical protein